MGKRNLYLIRTIMAVIMLVAGLSMNGPMFTAAAPLDYAIPNGHFYAQANGQDAAGGIGYSITDADGIAFWREFQRLGGVPVLGYPVSHRFIWNGTVVQVCQRAAIQWQPKTQNVAFVNVFDELASVGKDAWLQAVWSTPNRAWLDNEGTLSWPEVMRSRLAFLDGNAKIKATYYSVPDPLSMFGLPSSRIEDLGSVLVLRLQRAVIQQWKVDVPWAKSGDVTIANGGDIGKAANLFPADAIRPTQPNGQPAIPEVIVPGNSSKVIVLDPGHGGKEIGAAHTFADGTVLLEKAVNLKIGSRLATLLKEAGYRTILTRDTDSGVNTSGADLNNDKKVNTEDDLQARIDLANREKADLLISIHNNGHENKALRGTEVYYADERPFTDKNVRLAQMIQKSLVTAIRAAGYDTIDRGIKTDRSVRRGNHFFLLGPQGTRIARPSLMPAALGETLFLSNDEDSAQLRSDPMIEVIARGYAAGISQYLSSP